MKNRTDRVLDWVIGILAGMVILGLIFAVTTSAHAAPEYADDLTVARFIGFTANTRNGYVLGFISFGDMMGIQCPTAKSMGEYEAAILHNRVAFPFTAKLNDAFFKFLVDEGCRLPAKKERT